MLVDNNVYKNVYNGTGSTTSFPISFPFLDKAHIQVLRSTDSVNEEVVPVSEYTITGAGIENGGTCTFKVAPPIGVTIAIMRNVPITQLYAYRELDNFPAESHEDALAKLTMIDQQQQEQLNRALKVPSVSSKTPEGLMTELFQIRDDSQAAQSAAEAAQSAAEDCRDTACECASQAQNTLDNAIQVIQNQESISRDAIIAQEQASVTTVQTEGNTQAKLLEDIANTILISAASYNKSVSVKLTSPITNSETYTLPESMIYLVGRSQLYVSGNGVWFYKGFQYEEVGTDGLASAQIKFLQDLAVDDVLTFTVLASNVNVLTSINSGLVNDADGYLKINADGQTVLINASGQVCVPVMTGATASAAGTSGNVPAPQAGEQDFFLRGDGTWAVAPYLPLTGGTLTGPLNFSIPGTEDYIGRLVATNNEYGKRILIDTAEEGDNGAYIILRKGSDTINPGGFEIKARNSDSSVVKAIEARTDGNLRWDGKQIVRSVNGVNADAAGNAQLGIGVYITEKWDNGVDLFYRKWSDGRIEQGSYGTALGPGLQMITLPVPYKAAFHGFVCRATYGYDGGMTNPILGKPSLTQINIISGSNTNEIVMWYTCGY